jgi:hypothetical protein
VLELVCLFRDLQLLIKSFILSLHNQKRVNTGLIVSLSLLKSHIITTLDSVLPLVVNYQITQSSTFTSAAGKFSALFH